MDTQLDLTKILTEKLTYYTKSKLLEMNIKINEANEIISNLKEYLQDLAKKIVSNEITQKEAEKLIESKINEIVGKKANLTNVVEKLIEAYRSHLRELGYSEDKINEIINVVKFDIESLAKEVVDKRMTLKEALERVKRIPVPIESIEKPIIETTKPESEEVKIIEPERRTISLESEEDILNILNKEWACIVTKGVYNCLKEKYILPPVTMKQLVEAFAKVAKLVLHDRKPKYVREWFITGYCPMYDDIIKMLFMFGLDSETFKNWFRNMYNRYKPSLEAMAKIKLPDYEKFYNDFKEFIINYKLLQ